MKASLMRKSFLHNFRLLFIPFLFITSSVMAQLPEPTAACADCGRRASYIQKYGHAPTCKYYKAPVKKSSVNKSSGNSSPSVPSISSTPGSLDEAIDNSINFMNRLDPKPDPKVVEERKRQDDLRKSEEDARYNSALRSMKGMPSESKINKVNFNCKITSYIGAVEILRKGEIIAESGNIGEIELQPGDVIKTGTIGIVKLHFNFENGGKDLILGGNTEMEIIKNESGTNIPKLRRGRCFTAGETLPENVQKYVRNYFSNLKKQAMLKTPDAVCGVRGTIFTVDHDDATGSEFNVFDGSILVAPIIGTDSVLLTKGQKVVVNPKGEISDLLPADLKKLELWREEISQIESEENTIK